MRHRPSWIRGGRRLLTSGRCRRGCGHSSAPLFSAPACAALVLHWGHNRAASWGGRSFVNRLRSRNGHWLVQSHWGWIQPLYFLVSVCNTSSCPSTTSFLSFRRAYPSKDGRLKIRVVGRYYRWSRQIYGVDLPSSNQRPRYFRFFLENRF